MSGKIGVLIIHGMGSQRSGFHSGIVNELCDRLKQYETRFEWQDILWVNTIKTREDDLWKCMKIAKNRDGDVLDLDWIKIRKFIVHNFGDALAYHRDKHTDSTTYSNVHKIISDSIKNLKTKLNSSNSPIVVIAHSLGAHMMSNYIWDHQHNHGESLESIENLTSMITFGCNIPLFSLAYKEAKPINLPGSGITKSSLKNASKWLNFFDRDDVLGWPLKPLYEKNISQLNDTQKETVARIVDDEINVGSFLTNWNPGAHSNYWTDNDLTKPIADYLKHLVSALDE